MLDDGREMERGRNFLADCNRRNGDLSRLLPQREPALTSMNETDTTPLAQSLRRRFETRKAMIGYPFLDWSGRIISFLAYLSLVAAGVSIFRVLSTPALSLDGGQKALYVSVSVIAGIVSFILLKGLSSVCFLLLDLWKGRAQ